MVRQRLPLGAPVRRIDTRRHQLVKRRIRPIQHTPNQPVLHRIEVDLSLIHIFLQLEIEDLQEMRRKL